MAPSELEQITREVMQEESIQAQILWAAIKGDVYEVRFADFSTLQVFGTDEVTVRGGNSRIVARGPPKAFRRRCLRPLLQPVGQTLALPAFCFFYPLTPKLTLDFRLITAYITRHGRRQCDI